MILSSVLGSPMLFLQPFISTILFVLINVFTKVRSWTSGTRSPPNSPVSPTDGDLHQKKYQDAMTPESVNYHFTRQCNYKCGFCFHTAKTSFVLPLEEAKRGLKLLQDAGKFDRLYSIILCSIRSLPAASHRSVFSGMEKINFSGGEPFLHNKGEYLGKLVQYCKQDLRLPSVSIVSNGSMIKEKWFTKYGNILN